MRSSLTTSGRPLAILYLLHTFDYWHVCKKWLFQPPSGVHKTGIRGIQDTRQIADGKTNDIEITTKKVGTNS